RELIPTGCPNRSLCLPGRAPRFFPLERSIVMSETEQSGRPTPERLTQILSGLWVARAVATAVELGVFDRIAAGKDTLPGPLAAAGGDALSRRVPRGAGAGRGTAAPHAGG